MSLEPCNEIEVHVALAAAVLEGRVIDEDRRPVQAALVALRRGVRRAPGTPWPQTSTDEEGAWRLPGLESGPTRLLVSSDHRDVERLDVDLARGEQRSLEIVLPRVTIADDVRGTLVGPAQGAEPAGILHLVSDDGGSTDLIQMCFLSFDIFSESEPDGRVPFAFENLPAGRYRLSLTPMDGRRYEPQTLLVEPPAEVELATEELAQKCCARC